MKSSILLVLFIAAMYFCPAQNSSKDNTKLVEVDWGHMSIMITEKFWSDTKGELLKQVGEQKYLEIKDLTVTIYNKKVPNSLKIWDGRSDHKKLTAEEFYKRLSSLKVYELATCSQFFDGNEFKYTIVALPYQKLYFDSTAKWDTLYFVVLSDAVKKNKSLNESTSLSFLSL